MKFKSEWEKKTIKKLFSFTLHALVNICCSGNRDWSELAMIEYERRKKINYEKRV